MFRVIGSEVCNSQVSTQTIVQHNSIASTGVKLSSVAGNPVEAI